MGKYRDISLAPAPLHNDLARGPADGAAFWLTTRDGLRIRVAHWNAQASKGTVLLFPGRTEYIEKYGLAAAALAERGYATLTIDWRGQGLADRLMNDRMIGHVTRFSDYQLDVDALMTHAAAHNLPQPYLLIGHSMGGCIGLRALYKGLEVKAAAFSAPMWGIGIAPMMRPFAWTVSQISKTLGMAKRLAPGQSLETYLIRQPFEGNTLTTDPEMWDYMKAQVAAHPDLALAGPSLNWLNESLHEMRALHARPSPELPCVTYLGTAESIVDPARIHDRMARWPGGRLEVIEGAEHEIMMEGPETRTRFYDDVDGVFQGA